MGDPWFDVERAALRKVSHASWMRLRVAGVVGAYKCACIAYRAGQTALATDCAALAEREWRSVRHLWKEMPQEIFAARAEWHRRGGDERG